MAEIVSFGTPQSVGVVRSHTTFRVIGIDIRREPWSFRVQTLADEGLPTQITYDTHVKGPDAEGPVKAINKANCNPASGGKTMERRALEWQQNNINPETGVPYLPPGGTWSGSPD